MKVESRLVGDTWKYYVNGREVSETEYLGARSRNKQRGQRFRTFAGGKDWTDWGLENGGKGRYCPQLGRRPKDPAAYCQSRRDLIEKAKRRGMKVSDSD